MGTGKIPYLSFKVQLYFPNQGLTVILFAASPAKPLMGKYNCTFHDLQGIYISFTRGFAARKGNIPSPFFKMTGLGHSLKKSENLACHEGQGKSRPLQIYEELL